MKRTFLMFLSVALFAGPASAQVSPTLQSQVRQLIRYSKGNFDAIRVQATEKDQGGDYNYQVRGFNACGKASRYNKVWWWRTMKGNWEYVCDVDFKDEYTATKYYDDMSKALRGVTEFRWEEERVVSSETRRRLEGHHSNPNLKIMFDYDVAEDGSIEVEFWFKQKFNPGPVTGGRGGPTIGKPGASVVSPTFESQVKQLVNYSKSDFSAIRVDSSKTDQSGDWNYRVRGFNACGPSSQYNKVWWWRTMKGNWEYVCDVDFSNQADARAYYDEMKLRMTAISGWNWAAERKVNDQTVRRVEGRMSNPPLMIMFDYDLSADGSVEVEFWFKQKNNPGPVSGDSGGARPVPSSGGSGAGAVSRTLAKQVDQLLDYAKSDFSAIRIDSSRQDQGGDDNYRVRGFNACGPNSQYNKIWHWKTMKGNWEYVCDVDFTNEADATGYYNEMKRVLTSIRGFDWKPERAVDGTTRRRLEGLRSNPPLKIMFDYDLSADGSVEIEFWFKQRFNQ